MIRMVTMRTVAIAVVIGGDIGLLLMAFLNTSIQPYQSWEDWNKLAELADRDPERVKQILQKIVADHASSGSLKRIFGRPKMKRMP